MDIIYFSQTQEVVGIALAVIIGTVRIFPVFERSCDDVRCKKRGSKNGAGDSPQSSATASGITSRAASVSRMRPMTKAIIRLFTGLAFLY